MDLETDFDQAQLDSKNLPNRPDSATLLQLYALFKQATLGDVSSTRPSFADLIAQAKWDAWDSMRGTSNEQAMAQYVALVEDLKKSN